MAYLGFRITVFVATLLVCETTLILVTLGFVRVCMAGMAEGVHRSGILRGLRMTVPRYGSVVYGSMFLHQKAVGNFLEAEIPFEKAQHGALLYFHPFLSGPYFTVTSYWFSSIQFQTAEGPNSERGFPAGFYHVVGPVRSAAFGALERISLKKLSRDLHIFDVRICKNWCTFKCGLPKA